MHELPSYLASSHTAFNFGHQLKRVKTTQRPPRVLLHGRCSAWAILVVQVNQYRETLNWYLDKPGHDRQRFLFFPGQRALGPP